MAKILNSPQTAKPTIATPPRFATAFPKEFEIIFPPKHTKLPKKSLTLRHSEEK